MGTQSQKSELENMKNNQKKMMNTINDMKNIMDAPKIDLEEDEYEEIYFTKNLGTMTIKGRIEKMRDNHTAEQWKLPK